MTSPVPTSTRRPCPQFVQAAPPRQGAWTALRFCFGVALIGTASAADATQPPSPKAAARTSVSKRVSDEIRAGLPRYSFVASRATPAAADGDQGRIVLPKFLVPGLRTPRFNDSDLLTRAGRDAVAAKRYPGSNLKGDHGYDAYAHYGRQMVQDDERLRKLGDLSDTLNSLERAGGRKDDGDMKNELMKLALRRHDYIEESMDRSANNDRR